jgi:hypothetical protein
VEYIILCNNTSRPLLPNFFVETKGPAGKPLEMKLQITQDLAAGARGMHEMQSYGQEPVYDSNAYTIGATYHSGTGSLKLYAIHPTPLVDPNVQPEYHTTQIDSFDLTGNPNSCRQGIATFRNAQDGAREQMGNFITYANEVAARKLQQVVDVDDNDEDEDDGKVEDEDKEGGDDEDEKDEDDEDDEDQYKNSFMLQNQESTQIEHHFTGDTVLPESDTLTDELQRQYNPPAQRRSKPSYHFQRRKRTAGSSSI